MKKNTINFCFNSILNQQFFLTQHLKTAKKTKKLYRVKVITFLTSI